MSISYGLFATRLHVENKKSRYCRVALFCAFGFLNILTPIALAKSLSWYYPRVRAVASGRHFTACLYWAAALIAFLWNVIYTGTSLVQHYHNEPAITSCIVELSRYKCSIPSETGLYKDEVLTLAAKVTIIPIAVFVELVISILTVRLHISGKRYSSRYILRKHCLLQVVHVIGLWNILIVLQIFTMCAIPLCVLLVTHPQVTFLLLALLIMVLVGLTLIVGYLMYQCQSPRRRVCCSVRHCGRIIVHITVIISAVGLIIMLLMLYEMMLIAQVTETGITGIVLSLLPSLPLSALGWYVKRRSQRAVISECSEMSQSSEEQQPTNVTIQSSDKQSEDENPLPL